MENIQPLISSILTGISNACTQSYNFHNRHFANLRPEYLLTVNVAQQIKLDFDDFIIRLEENKHAFRKSSASLNARWESFTEIIRDKNFVERPGFVDMVIYDYFKKPICVIEIKGLNPQKTVLIEDVDRNIEFDLP